MAEYSCPVDGCTYSGTQTGVMNHLRLKQDSDHTELYQRFKASNTDSNDGNDSNDKDGNESNERPELKESFEDAMEDDENESVEVKDLSDSSGSGSSEYVDILECDIEDLVENGVADDHTEAKNMLLAAKKKGHSKVDPETGDVK